MFVLDPPSAVLLVEENVRIQNPQTYSLNEAYTARSPKSTSALSWAHENGYSSRFSGAMVADVHRVLVKGVFAYPPGHRTASCA